MAGSSLAALCLWSALFLFLPLASSTPFAGPLRPHVPYLLPRDLSANSSSPNNQTGRIPKDCPDYAEYSAAIHEPRTNGTYRLSYQRPVPACRTFNSSEVEATIKRYRSRIRDPDLFRLFENTFPNTLDTTVRWQGFAQGDPSEELAFIVTGDINAMWLRDSANQLHPYASLIKRSKRPDSLAALFRGTINLQARFLVAEPWCNSFQPPLESGLGRENRSAAYEFTPFINMSVCYTPNFELDSYGSFFQLSYDYYQATNDSAFFGRYQWTEAVKQILRVAKAQMDPFYDPASGAPLTPAYTFSSDTTSFTGSLGVGGVGNPVRFTGMVKSPFRPSDDSAIYQFLVPSNMIFSAYLAKGAEIMDRCGSSGAGALAGAMRELSKSIRAAIEKHAVVARPSVHDDDDDDDDDDKKKNKSDGGRVYAFEVDGYGNSNLMDDANLPSLLGALLSGYVSPGGPGWRTYRNTRAWVNSPADPWYIRGPVISGVGSPHTGVGRTWPMANIATILTSGGDGVDGGDDGDEEIVDQLRQLVRSTDGLGLMHESINSRNQSDWTRQWFAWANSLFGQMILDLGERKPDILAMSFQ